MLKHILTGQPGTASTIRQPHNNELQLSPGGQQQQQQPLPSNGTTGHHHHHQQQLQQYQQLQDAQLLHQHIHHHHQQHSSLVRGSAPRGGSSADVYDSIGGNSSSQIHRPSVAALATTPSSSHHHPLNHSQLSVNNLSQRLNHSHGLNLSTLSTSKHSVDSASPVVGGNPAAVGNSLNLHALNLHHNQNIQTPADHHSSDQRPKVNGGLDISRLSRIPSHATPSPAPVPAGNQGPSIVPLNASLASSFSLQNIRQQETPGVKEMLTSLGLLCLVSLLLAILSLIFLLKISPLTVTSSHEEYPIVYEVILALCALALSLNLCCLLVCAIQFLFAVKLVKSSYLQGYRTNKYLQKSSISRICAVGGFFISIPVFLTGMILYTFVQFDLTPAIVTSVFIGLGIIFCGCAMVHNVFVWQREKTNAMKALAREQCEAAAQHQRQQMQQQQQQHQQQQQNSHHQHKLQSSQHLHQQSQHHHQHQSRGTSQSTLHGSALARSQKIAALPQTHSSATISSSQGRGQNFHTHNHNHGNVPNSQSHLHHQLAGSHRNVATPPTPGELSPPSPSHKHNRSHVLSREISGSVSPGLPAATLDLSSAATTNSPHELSTLV